jgi:hypothetical protein
VFLRKEINDDNAETVSKRVGLYPSSKPSVLFFVFSGEANLEKAPLIEARVARVLQEFVRNLTRFASRLVAIL